MSEESASLAPLVDLVVRLTGPDGCPWDREQELRDLRAYLLEEAHETAAAIADGDLEALADELGDLLYLVVFVAHLARRAGAPALGSIIAQAESKMVERHPHVFAGESVADAAEVRSAWEQRKARGRTSLLGGVPLSLPALLAAFRMGQKAAGVGFDWRDSRAVLAKVHEELGELEETLARSLAASAREATEEELGDLLLTIASLARHLDIDPEAALARANEKFRRRFQSVEAQLASAGKSVANVDSETLERLWEASKTGR